MHGAGAGLRCGTGRRRCASGRTSRRPSRRSAPVDSTLRDLVGEHRRRGVGILQRERAAEPAARVGLRQLDQVDALHRAAAADSGLSPTRSIRSEWQVGW